VKNCLLTAVWDVCYPVCTYIYKEKSTSLARKALDRCSSAAWTDHGQRRSGMAIFERTRSCMHRRRGGRHDGLSHYQKKTIPLMTFPILGSNWISQKNSSSPSPHLQELLLGPDHGLVPSSQPKRTRSEAAVRPPPPRSHPMPASPWPTPRSVRQAAELHALLATSGRLPYHPPSASHLLNALTNCLAPADPGNLRYALALFDRTPRPTTFLFDTALRACFSTAACAAGACPPTPSPSTSSSPRRRRAVPDAARRVPPDHAPLRRAARREPPHPHVRRPRARGRRAPGLRRGTREGRRFVDDGHRRAGQDGASRRSAEPPRAGARGERGLVD
jgi:hypothetical protein